VNEIYSELAEKAELAQEDNQGSSAMVFKGLANIFKRMAKRSATTQDRTKHALDSLDKLDFNAKIILERLQTPLK